MAERLARFGRFRNGINYILSNNHVLANSDSAATGDAIIQPGLIDNPAPNSTCTNCQDDNSCKSFAVVTLEGNPLNPVDAAIAQIVSGKVDTSGNILLLGVQRRTRTQCRLREPRTPVLA